MAEYDLAEARDLLTKNRDGVLKVLEFYLINYLIFL